MMNDHSYFVGLDIGTSSAKGGIFDDRGCCIAKRTVAYEVNYLKPTWCEGNPEDWWRATKVVIKEALKSSQVDPGDIAGVGISSMVPTCLPLDRRGTPLRKAILWLDRRSVPQCEWINTNISSDRCVQISGNTINPYFLGPKILWLKQNEPHVLDKTWKIVQAYSYVTFRLTGEVGMDFSCAGLSAPLFDQKTRGWSEGMFSDLGLSLETLPKLYPSHKLLGEVSEIGAQETGLKKGTPVVVGGGDFAVSTLSAGVINEGETCMMLGTAGNLLIVRSEPGSDPRVINTNHVFPGRFISFGITYAGGNLQWFTKLFQGTSGADTVSYTMLDKEAGCIKPGSENLLFFPYLVGQLTLTWDPDLRSLFFGLSVNHGRGHLFRAILEGVGYEYRLMYNIMKGKELTIDKIMVVNGGGKSTLWRQIISDIMGLPLLYIPDSEGAPLGDAILAAMGVGIVSDECVLRNWLPSGSVTRPNPENQQIYDASFDLYQRIYKGLGKYFR